MGRNPQMSVLTECELEDTARSNSSPPAPPLTLILSFFFPTSLSFFPCRCKDTLFNLSPSKKDLHPLPPGTGGCGRRNSSFAEIARSRIVLTKPRCRAKRGTLKSSMLSIARYRAFSVKAVLVQPTKVYSLLSHKALRQIF
jgi:hypothetical protein